MSRANFFQQPRTYIYVPDALYTHPHYLHYSNQRRIYTSFYYFSCDQNIFMQATKDVFIRPPCTSAAANDVYIRPHIVTFYRYLVVGCIFLWLLSYIYKPFNIIEIMSNCNTNSQEHIYIRPYYNGFQRPWLLNIHWDSYSTNKKSFRALDKLRLYKALHCKINKKEELLQFLACVCLLGWQYISYSLVYVTFPFLIKSERERAYILICQFPTKISAVDFRLVLKNCSSYFRVTFSKTLLVAAISLRGCGTWRYWTDIYVLG